MHNNIFDKFESRAKELLLQLVHFYLLRLFEDLDKWGRLLRAIICDIKVNSEKEFL